MDEPNSSYEALKAILTGKGAEGADELLHEDDLKALRETRSEIEQERIDFCMALHNRSEIDLPSALLTLCRWNLELQGRLEDLEQEVREIVFRNPPMPAV